MKTLEQLKAENEALEQQPEANPQAAPDEVTEAEATEEEASTTEAEGGEGGTTEADAEGWMKGDDQASQGAGERKFTDHDVAAAKNKLRAKLETRHQSEIEKLQQQLEEERRKNQQVPQVGEKPRLEQFYDKDNPEEAFAEALVEWKLNASAAQQHQASQQYEQQRQAIEQQRTIETSVDQHYERAAKLAEASGITPELYQAADRNVREAVEAVFPNGGGEHVTNALIANLGEGSEKVLYHLGVNQARRTELQNLLRQDQTGLRASIYLGKLSAELTNPARKTSNAPKPATQIQGDRQTTEAGRALRQKYNDAHKAGNVQKAVSLKREAKASGVDTRDW